MKFLFFENSNWSIKFVYKNPQLSSKKHEILARITDFFVILEIFKKFSNFFFENYQHFQNFRTKLCRSKKNPSFKKFWNFQWFRFFNFQVVWKIRHVCNPSLGVIIKISYACFIIQIPNSYGSIATRCRHVVTRRWEFGATEPIGMARARHLTFSVSYVNHLPRSIVTRRANQMFVWMEIDPANWHVMSFAQSFKLLF